MKPALAALAFLALAAPAGARELKVCADPNNLPFSNQAKEGFENKLADMIAADLHARVEYTWWAQRRGYVRNTITAGACDVLMGVPGGFERTLVTRPYYRSSYVFVTRRDRGLRIRSFDDLRASSIAGHRTNTPSRQLSHPRPLLLLVAKPSPSSSTVRARLSNPEIRRRCSR